MRCFKCGGYKYRRNSDVGLRELERLVIDDPQTYLFPLTLAQMRHGFVSLTTLVTAIIHLEVEGKKLASINLRSHPGYKAPGEAMNVNEEVWFEYKPWGGFPGHRVYRKELPIFPGSNFHLMPCPHCRCPIWSADCEFCGWEQEPTYRISRYETPWTMERYLNEVKKYKNFFEFYTKKRFGRPVPEYAEAASAIRDAMLSLDIYEWPSFEEIRLTFGLAPRGICQEKDCDEPTSSITTIRGALPYPTDEYSGLAPVYKLKSGDPFPDTARGWSQIPGAEPYCIRHKSY